MKNQQKAYNNLLFFIQQLPESEFSGYHSVGIAYTLVGMEQTLTQLKEKLLYQQ